MVAFKTVVKYACSPPIPLSLLTKACEQAHEQMWEPVSTMIVGAMAPAKSIVNVAGQHAAEPAVVVLCRRTFDTDVIDIPYPSIRL